MEVLTTVEYATTYYTTKLDTAKWTALSATDKLKYLYEATRQIYAIKGFKFTPEIINSLIIIPTDLQDACCEVALELINTGNEANVHAINKKLGISSISFGRDSVSYGDSDTSGLGLDNSIFNNYAQSLLDKYIIKAYPYV